MSFLNDLLRTLSGGAVNLEPEENRKRTVPRRVEPMPYMQAQPMQPRAPLAGSQDNQITNQMVADERLPQDQAEIYQQAPSIAMRPRLQMGQANGNALQGSPSYLNQPVRVRPPSFGNANPNLDSYLNR